MAASVNSVERIYAWHRHAGKDSIPFLTRPVHLRPLLSFTGVLWGAASSFAQDPTAEAGAAQLHIGRSRSNRLAQRKNVFSRYPLLGLLTSVERGYCRNPQLAGVAFETEFRCHCGCAGARSGGVLRRDRLKDLLAHEDIMGALRHG
jgi:hypothetical protein